MDYNLMHKKKSKLASLMLIVFVIVNLIPVTLLESGIKTNKVYADPTGVSDGVTATNTTLANVYNSITKFFESETFFNDLLEASLKEVAKAALREMTTSTVNWINSGFEGKPLYFENPKSFYISLRDQQVQTFIDEIGYDSVKYPFGQDYALGLIDSVSRRFEDNARYSLNEAIEATSPGSTAEDFYEDFDIGGWDAFLSMATIPANNPVGFQYEAQKEIEERTLGTEQSPAEIIKEKVNQGQGFLSPQECTAEGYVGPAETPWLYPPYIPPVDSDSIYDETYDTYYNMYIEYSGPEYEGTDDYISEQTVHDNAVAQAIAAANAAETTNGEAQIQYVEDKAADLEAYNTAHTCPEDKWVDRTPGYVVADQITSALGSNWTQSELGAAVGSSLSAVFDALFNELFDKGLSILSDGTETVTEDLWSYEGLTLGGSGSDDTLVGGSSWTGTADVVVDLYEKLVNGTGGDTTQTDIARTTAEADLLRTTLTQTQQLPQKMFDLDECIPGMNFQWEDRADKAFQRETQKLVRKANKDNDNASEAEAALNTLETDYGLAKTDMTLRMIDSNIPSATTMSDVVASITGAKFESSTYFDLLIERSTTVSRLNSMRASLLAGTAEEELIPQYIALMSKITTDASLESAKLTLDTINDKLVELGEMKTQCEYERANVATLVPDDIGLIMALTGGGITLDSWVPGFLDIEVTSIYDGGGEEKTEDELRDELINEIEDEGCGFLDFGCSEDGMTSSVNDLNLDGLQYVHILVFDGDLSVWNALKEYAFFGSAFYGSISLSAEESYFCQQIMGTVNEDNIYRSIDVNLQCADFYHGTLSDYFIDYKY
jgi:hypothetical protein